MRSFGLTWMSVLMALSLGACSHSNKSRTPANFRGTYNADHTRLLRVAAENGILFQVPDSVIRDLPQKSAGEGCRSNMDGPWSEEIYKTLRILQQNPRLSQRVHVIELRRGDRPQAEISKDLDGAVTLVLSYAKVENRERIHSLSDIPCTNGNMDLVGREMTVSSFEYPNEFNIVSLLSSLPDRPKVDRLSIDTGFLIWLADRMTIFRFSPDLSFEKTHTGQPLLPVYFAQMRNDILQRHNAVEFWMNEISKRSRAAQSLMFFGLKKDLQGTLGVQVDSAGKFSRRMNGLIDPTYPYLSYRVENNTFAITRLQQLDSCLGELMRTYQSPMSVMGTFEMDANSFLFPGHHCP